MVGVGVLAGLGGATDGARPPDDGGPGGIGLSSFIEGGVGSAR